MTEHSMDTPEIRPGEVTGPTPDRADAAITFIGRLRTPFLRREDCPRRGDAEAGPVCRVEVDAPFRPALQGLAAGMRLELLYWMHRARRDLLVQAPRQDPTPRGTFALRAPNRPNPIATSIVLLEAVTPDGLLVRGLDCLDGTPLVDIKPDFRRPDQAMG
jgi:tRNA-Thr(GGU) m(6)t(6)A37 methyltransferase TsaA